MATMGIAISCQANPVPCLHINVRDVRCKYQRPGEALPDWCYSVASSVPGYGPCGGDTTWFHQLFMVCGRAHAMPMPCMASPCPCHTCVVCMPFPCHTCVVCAIPMPYLCRVHAIPVSCACHPYAYAAHMLCMPFPCPCHFHTMRMLCMPSLRPCHAYVLNAMLMLCMPSPCHAVLRMASPWSVGWLFGREGGRHMSCMLCMCCKCHAYAVHAITLRAFVCRPGGVGRRLPRIACSCPQCGA